MNILCLDWIDDFYKTVILPSISLKYSTNHEDNHRLTTAILDIAHLSGIWFS